MTRYREHDDDFSDLEGELRRRRSEPPPELVRQLSAALAAPAPERRGARFRLGLAVSFATVVLVSFSALGGLGYAKSSASGAAKGASTAVTSVFEKKKGKAAKRALKTSFRTTLRKAPLRADDGVDVAAAGVVSAAAAPVDAGSKPVGPTAEEESAPSAPTSSPSAPAAAAATAQYQDFIIVCYPIPTSPPTFVNLFVPLSAVGNYVPPGTLGPCGF